MKLFIKNKNLNLNKIRIMGILNITPDSFFDGGKYYRDLSKAIDQVDYMVANGATFIDIGGESTRPGADIVGDEEEAERVIPIIDAVAKRFDIFISVNTSSALVIRESVVVGAHLINDVRALMSQEAMQAAVHSKLPICLVHMQGDPCSMQRAPRYDDVVKEVSEYFVQQIFRCESFGIFRDQLLLDPGFGFGKSIVHNYQLLKNLEYFHNFQLPIIVGISRKSMLSLNHRNKYCNTIIAPKKRLMGSIACAVIAAMKGVHIVRVHDVKETAEALCVIDAMLEQKSYSCKDSKYETL